ncbi:MAG: tRNA uridine-5-carboxymethylaminomethyl(34) synthesis GTPase MnmE, partial [Victivallaceae bacterium]|nr:tRNA uridine-5-carboxymethylaminomethyl(34) synthesis GTPase MnmE [Victivallaceae bacterium]
MNTTDNIAAPATAVGGAITILRISGPDALAIGNHVWSGHASLSHAAVRRVMLGRCGGDTALAVFMQGPASYTGDDVVELHCHGGAAAARHVLSELLKSGCRMAEPGEFTFRAFVNGKLDLMQAEAVAEIIGSGSDFAYRSAEARLAGAFSDELRELRAEAVAIRAECESHLDFPDEELDWDETLPQRIDRLRTRLEALAATGRLGEALTEGVAITLAGKPNSGKSSLLNRLLGNDRAIVTDIPGTTRDTLECGVELRGIPVKLTDTAGLRISSDPVEKLGVERSRRAITGAELVFWVLDASAADPATELAELRDAAPARGIAVWNKCDLLPCDASLPETDWPAVRISALDGTGLEHLLDCFAEQVTGAKLPEKLPAAA